MIKTGTYTWPISMTTLLAAIHGGFYIDSVFGITPTSITQTGGGFKVDVRDGGFVGLLLICI